MRFWDPEVAKSKPYSSVILAAYLDRNEDFPQSYLCAPLYLLSAHLASGRPWEEFNTVELDLRAAQARTGIVHAQMGVRANADAVRRVLQKNWVLEKHYSLIAARRLIQEDSFDEPKTARWVEIPEPYSAQIIHIQEYLYGPRGPALRDKILTTADLFFAHLRDEKVQEALEAHKQERIRARAENAGSNGEIFSTIAQQNLGTMLLDRLEQSDTPLSVSSLKALLNHA